MGCGPSSEGQDVWAQSTQKVVNHQHHLNPNAYLAPTHIRVLNRMSNARKITSQKNTHYFYYLVF